jgi:hypothetical protein
MAGDITNQTNLSTFKRKPRTGYQEQVFNDQLVLNFPATLQSAAQSMGYTSVQGYFTVPRPESPAAPAVSQNLITQTGDFLTTEAGDQLITQ